MLGLVAHALRRCPVPTTAFSPGFAIGYATLFYAWSRGSCGAPAPTGSPSQSRLSVSVGLVIPFFLLTCRSSKIPASRGRWTTRGCIRATWRSYLASSAWLHRWMLDYLGNWNNEVLFPGFVATRTRDRVGSSPHSGIATRPASHAAAAAKRHGSTARSRSWCSGRRWARRPGSTRSSTRRFRSSRSSAAPAAWASSSCCRWRSLQCFRRSRAPTTGETRERPPERSR